MRVNLEAGSLLLEWNSKEMHFQTPVRVERWVVQRFWEDMLDGE
jgi:hypothetical protein